MNKWRSSFRSGKIFMITAVYMHSKRDIPDEWLYSCVHNVTVPPLECWFSDCTKIDPIKNWMSSVHAIHKLLLCNNQWGKEINTPKRSSRINLKKEVIFQLHCFWSRSFIWPNLFKLRFAGKQMVLLWCLFALYSKNITQNKSWLIAVVCVKILILQIFSLENFYLAANFVNPWK